MKPITFTVPGIPVAKGRGRAVRVGAGVRIITPTRTRSYEAQVAWFGREAMAGRALIVGPLAVRIVATWPQPTSTPKRLRSTRQPRTSRPDADNLAKAVCDALNGVVWADDSQVAQIAVEKWTGCQGEPAGVAVEISCIERTNDK